jgi:hypothetical protein
MRVNVVSTINSVAPAGASNISARALITRSQHRHSVTRSTTNNRAMRRSGRAVRIRIRAIVAEWRTSERSFEA